MNYKGSKRFRLVIPRFVTGAASALDIGGVFAPTLEELYSHWESPQDVDTYMLASDWAMIGQDFRQAIAQALTELDQED